MVDYAGNLLCCHIVLHIGTFPVQILCFAIHACRSYLLNGICYFHFLLTDKDIAPKTVNDLKLINAGRILENNRTLAESHVPVGEIPGGVITMHVVVRPPQVDKNSGIADNFSPLFIPFS